MSDDDVTVMPCVVCGAPVELLTWDGEAVSFVDHADDCPIG